MLGVVKSVETVEYVVVVVGYLRWVSLVLVCCYASLLTGH